MKAKLIKKENNYYLTTEKQTSLCYHLGHKELLEVKGVGEKSGEVHHNKGWNKPDEVMFIDTEAKLSKQNCDEIFGVVDVDGLARKWRDNSMYRDANAYSYKAGFNKAMGLNKDKVFTLEDMQECWDAAHQAGRFEGKGIAEENWQTFDGHIQSIQQPTEIEVEIEMAEYPDLPYYKGPEPKLDSQGCLILKRVV